MDSCLLCLETNKNFNEAIKVNSEQWNKQNIKLLIEKHLWPMVNQVEYVNKSNII